MQKTLLLLIVILLTTQCTSEQNNPTPAPTQPTSTPTQESPTSIPIEERQEYERQYEQLRQIHTEISAIWEGLSEEESAQCSTITFNIPTPSIFSGESPIQQHMHDAARELTDAINLWQEECSNPRESAPQDVINQGILRTRAAGDALSAVESILTEN